VRWTTRRRAHRAGPRGPPAPALSGRPGQPQPRVPGARRGTRVRRRPRSSNRCRHDPAGATPLPSIHRPSRGVVPAQVINASGNHANAGRCLHWTAEAARSDRSGTATTGPSGANAPMPRNGRSVPSGGHAQRTTSRMSRRPTGPLQATAPITRYPGFATAGRTTVSRGPSTARDPVSPGIRLRTLGSTTFRRCAWAESREAG
jgi:hypothetical protein